MIIYICAFTEKGMSVISDIQTLMPSHIFVTKEKNISLHSWVKSGFELRAPIIFVGACGIAVRSIASFVYSKLSDSPVIVIDEKKQYVIPILSGHVGGANELACEVAGLLGAEAVITTATDINNLFAVDVWARENGLAIYNRDGIGKVSAKVIKGEKVTLAIRTSLSICTDSLPESIELVSGKDVDDCEKVTFSEKSPDCEKVADIIISDAVTDSERCQLLLIPKRICIGIGCRKDTDVAVIEKRVAFAMAELNKKYTGAFNDIYEDIYGVASIDLKAKEFGLNAFAQENGVRLVTFSSEELQAVEGEYTESKFVEKVTGVSNICEKAAVLLATDSVKAENCHGAGEQAITAMAFGDDKCIAVRKMAADGVTVAIAIRGKCE